MKFNRYLTYASRFNGSWNQVTSSEAQASNKQGQLMILNLLVMDFFF